MNKLLKTIAIILLLFPLTFGSQSFKYFAPIPLPDNTNINFLNFGSFYAIKYNISGFELGTEDEIWDSGTITNPNNDVDEILGHKYWYPYQACAHLEIWTKATSGSSWVKLGDEYANVINCDIQDEMIINMECDYEWWLPPPK